MRSGFFAPWVADHVHLGVRPADRNPRRATGSLRLSVDVPVSPLPWDGTGRVVARGETYVTLDAPAHPAPGERWVGGGGRPTADPGVALDGGCPHYPGGGALGTGGRIDDESREVALAGTPVGHTGGGGRTVRWRDVTVTANGHPVTGVSLAIARDAGGITLVSRDGHPFVVGDRIAVDVVPGGE